MSKMGRYVLEKQTKEIEKQYIAPKLNTMSITKVKNYTDEQLLNRAIETPEFRGFPPGYFIIGVRSNEDTFDTYDDKFYIFVNPFKESIDVIEGIKFIEVLTGTTNPGGKVLKGGFLRFNKIGAAILKSDYWHYDMWYPTYRTSRGYELRQSAKVFVYRDGNKNEKSEEIGTPIYGNYGINFHTNTFKYYNSVVKSIIGIWSAGCQVTNDRMKFIRFLKLFLKRKKEGKQSKISYCLLKEF